jgi:hypothetical protein
MAYDNQHILVIALSKDFLQVIMLIDTLTKNILINRQILHSVPYKIKDVVFKPQSTRNFVTCGIQHMCFWKQTGKNLEYQVGQIAVPKGYSSGSNMIAERGKINRTGMATVCRINPKELQKMAEDEGQQNVYVTFLVMAYIKETLIAGGDDGCLYLWESNRIVLRQAAHDSAILTLHAFPENGTIATGGKEGNAFLWVMRADERSGTKRLDKIRTYQLSKNVDTNQAISEPKHNI